MKAMLLAAGLGKRMLPLTKDTPKPLLKVGGNTLIGHQLNRIKMAGITEVVINVAYLGQKIIDTLGDGADLGLNITYSQESEPLETAGGIDNALSALGDAPFLLVNGDVWSDFPLQQLTETHLNEALGCLVMVANPNHNTGGDFQLANGKIQWCTTESEVSYTYSGLALIRPELLLDYPNRRQVYPLKEVFDWAIGKQVLSGVVHSGTWIDVGTPERLYALNEQLSKRSQ